MGDSGLRLTLDSGYICLRVVSIDDGHEIHFRLLQTAPMWRLKESYSTRLGVAASCLTFLYAGRRIQDNDTPRRLEMEEQDVIEVVGDQERIGGSSPRNHQYILLRVKDKDGNEIHFRVKKSTKLRKLKISYYKRKRSPWAQDSLHFLTFQYRGRGIRDEDTPETLQMEEGDIIEVLRDIERTGPHFGRNGRTALYCRICDCDLESGDLMRNHIFGMEHERKKNLL